MHAREPEGISPSLDFQRMPLLGVEGEGKALNDDPHQSILFEANCDVGTTTGAGLNDEAIRRREVPCEIQLELAQQIRVPDIDFFGSCDEAHGMELLEHVEPSLIQESCDNHDREEEASPRVENVDRSENKSPDTWQRMVAVIAVSGTNRFTLEQFDFFRNTVNWVLARYAPNEQLIPSYYMVQRTLLPFLCDRSFPRSEKHLLPVDLQTSGAKSTESRSARVPEGQLLDASTGTTNNDNVPKAAVQIILPSTWAMKDVSFKPTWDLLKSGISAEMRTSTIDPLFPPCRTAS